MDGILPGLHALPNVHPLLVHFPLALWPVALAFMVFAYVKVSDDAFRFGTGLWHIGLAGALVAAISGWLAAEGIGHDQPGHELVHNHRNLMLAAVVVAVVAAVSAYWTRREEHRQKRWLTIGFVLITCLLAALGADRGGLLVYGHGVGVRAEAPTVNSPPRLGEAHGHADHKH